MKTNKGFTLIEALVAFVIIAIFAGIIVPIVVLVGCKAERPIVKAPVMPTVVNQNWSFTELEYQGHRYLREPQFMIHAEHCPCKTNRVVLE